MESLILFTTSRCPNCGPVKTEMDRLGLDYKTIVADENDDNMRMAREWVVGAVPTLLVLKNVGENNVLEGRYIGDKIYSYLKTNNGSKENACGI